MKKLSKKKIVKYVIMFVIALVAIISIILIYNNLFAPSNSNRFDGIEEYKLTKKEKEAVKEKFNEIEKIKSIDVYTNSKIIKIFIKTTEDINFDNIKALANESLTSFSEENLSFYDVEIFVESLNEDSTLYPQIGYKCKTCTEFVW